MFPIAALLEVGNVNLSRVELIWSPITTHLSEVRKERDGGREEKREREGEKVRGERERGGGEISSLLSHRPAQ